MRRLWLYNPENDIALAFGGTNFTPPRQARLLSLYGAPLMWWMGEEGDGVLVELLSDDAYRDSAMRWLEETERRFGRGPALVADVRKVAVEECVPWGWSRHAVRRFLDSGVDERALSAASGLVDCIRMLSHRRSSIAITRADCGGRFPVVRHSLARPARGGLRLCGGGGLRPTVSRRNLRQIALVIERQGGGVSAHGGF